MQLQLLQTSANGLKGYFCPWTWGWMLTGSESLNHRHFIEHNIQHLSYLKAHGGTDVQIFRDIWWTLQILHLIHV